MISVEDYLYFVDEALDAMFAIVTDLGDDLANRRVDVPGANSPYAIVTHCLGVIDYWAGELVAGRAIERDREAEFRASGRVADLIERAHAARGQLQADLATVQEFAPLRGVPRPRDAGLPISRTQGGALMHLYAELAQHCGQLEVTRDVLLASPR